ncbi:MAG: PD40 domain-containing protein [Acidobacteria bacterium]|nr:PD40 domain-containing protein [Acidobacteriota bacterium]
MQRSRIHLIIAIVSASIALTVFTTFAQQQNPRQLFEHARMLDESNQNLTEAIKLYGQVVKQAQEQRALAARAQLRVGLLYERLGRKAEAQRAFQAVVSQYADQADVVRQAQAKLPKGTNAVASMNHKAATGLTVRRVPIETGMNPSAVSPDGRYLIGENDETKDLIVQDLITGEKRRLMNKPSNKDEWFEDAILSPEGKQIATVWGTNEDRFHELRIMGIDGSGSRLLYRKDTYLWPGNWSPDGKYILTEFDEEKKESMALISVADGSARLLKSVSFEKRPGGISGMYFSPDGRYIAYGYYPPNGSDQHDIAVIASDGSRDVPLVQSPADDQLLGWTPDGKGILFSSDRSGTIDAWVIPVADGKLQGSPELVKHDLGKIWPMGITSNGAFYYGLGRRTIERDMYTATLAPETGKLVGSPVLAKTRYIGFSGGHDWSPDGRYLAYRSQLWLREGNPGVDKLIILNPETGEERAVQTKLRRFSPPRWFPDGKSILVRDQAEGAGLFKIDAETGNTTLLVPEKPGSELFGPVLSRDEKEVFYQNKNILWKRNIETGEEKELYRATTPTKNPALTGNIALSPDGRRFAVKFGQSLIVIPVAGGDTRELLKLREHEPFTSYGTVAWTPDGRNLLFIDGGDKQPELWRIPAGGGEPQQLGQLMEGAFDLRIHPAGRRIAFSASQKKNAEVWVMENFLPATQAQKASVSRR